MTKFIEMTINPRKAEEILQHNYENNRPVRKSWVNQLASMMKKGKFISQNGETIIIGEDGVLYNGQHRLNAVIQSGVTLTFDIAIITNEQAAYRTMDNGAKRLAADFVEGDNKNNRSALAKIAYCLEYGSASMITSFQGKTDSNEQVSRLEVSEYANNNKELIGVCVKTGARLRSAIGAGAVSSYALFCFLIKKYGDETLLEEFVNETCVEMRYNKTCNALVNLIRKSYLSQKKPTKNWLVGTLLDAYDHFTKMDDSTMLNHANSKLSQFAKQVEAARAERSEQ